MFFSFGDNERKKDRLLEGGVFFFFFFPLSSHVFLHVFEDIVANEEEEWPQLGRGCAFTPFRFLLAAQQRTGLALPPQQPRPVRGPMVLVRLSLVMAPTRFDLRCCCTD